MSHTLNKVSHVTFAFWVMKISATTLGETGGDLLSMTLNLGYVISTVIFFGIFIATLVPQVASKSYHHFLYWAVIISTTTAGTTMSDYLDRTAGLGYVNGSLVLVTILVCILALWRFALGSISVDNITEPKVEIFYWITILFSNTLGTALGDFLADSSGLLTRPLGATLGDLLTKTHEKGGLDLGTIGSSLVLACFLTACILVTNRRSPGGAGR